MTKGDKSLFTAYLCWMFGGIIGLHHLYLGRDEHAFITFATCGGYFTLGLIRDLWRLPEYVKDANNDLRYLEHLHDQMNLHKRPPSGIVRHSGMMLVGNLLAYLADYAIPSEVLHDSIAMSLKFLLVPLGSAIGVWLVGNVGRHQGAIKWPLIAAYLAEIPSFIFSMPSGSFSTLAATIAFHRYSKEWRIKKRKPRSILKRAVILCLWVSIYLSLWASWLYFGCTIEDPETHEPIKCRVAIMNLINSPAYRNLSEAILMFVEQIRHRGFSDVWREIMQEFDVSGKTTALSTLGLPETASPQEILAQYKKLSRDYHPDREKDESKKAEKHEKFIQVQEAFRVLESSVKRYKIQEQARDEL